MGDEGLITPRTPTRQRIQDLVLAGPTPRVSQMVSEPVNELMAALLLSYGRPDTYGFPHGVGAGQPLPR